MDRIECFFQEKLNPIYKAHYALWIYWWPLWRSLYSGQAIRRLWQKYNLIQENQCFLDFGCGTGDFSIPAAKIVGKKGTVYALDCFPRQLQVVQKRARKEGLSNIVVMRSDTKVALPDECIDIIWMCDVFHEISEKRAVLQEMHRVLKKGGILAMYDGMKDRIFDYTDGLFLLNDKHGSLFRLAKK